MIHVGQGEEGSQVWSLGTWLYWAVQEGMSLHVLRWMAEQGALWDDDTRYGITDRYMKGGSDGNETAVWCVERLGMRKESRAAQLV